MAVQRIYVEKRVPYAVEAKKLLAEIQDLLGISRVSGLRILNRYDVEGLDKELFRRCGPLVFFEPQLDESYEDIPAGAAAVFAVEYLPGQYDQRADSCAQCIQLISQGARPAVATARVYLLEGAPTAGDIQRIKEYVINPVESREASLPPKATLAVQYETPDSVAVVEDFLRLDAAGLKAFVAEYGLAMDAQDAEFCQKYFRDEGRSPTITEIRMIDTYWSDHCRHTTFGAHIAPPVVQHKDAARALARYLRLRKELGREETPITLMDIATIGARYLKHTGQLANLDQSDEINACSVKITVDNNGQDEDWLLMFKNETHNHPTEIEPFGGAATCIGGAIRDPLSGRSYVYQAMRVTGAGNPLQPVSATLPGKRPQRQLVTTAAAGYSAYGNQIGLATGLVDEWYHPGYVAKRMEIGAVIGAAPAAHVCRRQPQPGDVVVLLGGRTGRDGIGGATGSSKAHGRESLQACGAEVQKGNPPEERKLQRLFRNPEVTRLIKRCNDFGAGGVAVAIGELADGLEIDLDAVPKKYEGLDGTELAISESQERMAVVLAPEDVKAFLEKAAAENLEATAVAVVTANPRLVMRWKGQTIADVSREFLNSNGAKKHARAQVPQAEVTGPLPPAGGNLEERLCRHMGGLNLCSNKGLAERFDSSIGAATVLMPFGGQNQLTPIQAMVAKLPVPGETTTCSGMAYGFNPFLMEQDPYRGAYLAVVESLCRLVAGGFCRQKCWLTFQEYFEQLRQNPLRWGKPLAALLGALDAQLDLGVAAIGGKDSMSGSFEELDVPSTLVSFAVGVGHVADIISPEFKAVGHTVALLAPKGESPGGLLEMLDNLHQAIKEGRVLSAWALGHGGIAEGFCKMALGNSIGVALTSALTQEELFGWQYGSLLLELAPGEELGRVIGCTTAEYTFSMDGQHAGLAVVQAAYEATLEPVLPYHTQPEQPCVKLVTFTAGCRVAPKIGIAQPRALVPVFPGTNCEYDTARALERAGAAAEILVLCNRTPADVSDSLARMEAAVRGSQMVVLPGGFSAGDEPDGSAKFIAAFFRNPRITEAVHDLLKNRDGLMLGICNGFQALIKLGLVPYGEIVDIARHSPTLTYNTIGRHQSMLVRTRVASNLSPWLSLCTPGEQHTVAVSHGEGRFVAGEEWLARLAQNGQIATQYLDLSGNPTMDIRCNPNGSAWAIEGITSPDGRVLGKMGHSERSGDMLYKNVEGNKYQPIFEGGVGYFA